MRKGVRKIVVKIYHFYWVKFIINIITYHQHTSQTISKNMFSVYGNYLPTEPMIK